MLFTVVLQSITVNIKLYTQGIFKPSNRFITARKIMQNGESFFP